MLRNREYVRVAESITEGWRVSTVWLGIDYSFAETGPPIIFETMIFAPGHCELDGWQDRYATEEAARAGHDQACALVRDHLAGLGSLKDLGIQ